VHAALGGSSRRMKVPGEETAAGISTGMCTEMLALATTQRRSTQRSRTMDDCLVDANFITGWTVAACQPCKI